MFTVDSPTLVHEIPYRSSGSSAPRDLTLQIQTVRYRSDHEHAPTFLATADLQGRENGDQNRLLGELLADEITVLQELEALPFFDLCLLCGDFYDYPDLRKLGGTGDVTSAFNALAGVASKTVAVLGNHDVIDDENLRPDITILDGSTIATDSIVVGGVSGIVGSPHRNNRKTEPEFIAAMDKCSTSRTDLLLLHQGPVGGSEEARGLEVVNLRLRRRSELLVLFGHCHWAAPFHTEGKNLFCNVDGRVLAFVPTPEI